MSRLPEYRQQENTLNMRDPPQGTSPKILLECKAGCGSGHKARWLDDEHVSSNISSFFVVVAELGRKKNEYTKKADWSKSLNCDSMKYVCPSLQVTGE